MQPVAHADASAAFDHGRGSAAAAVGRHGQPDAPARPPARPRKARASTLVQTNAPYRPAFVEHLRGVRGAVPTCCPIWCGCGARPAARTSSTSWPIRAGRGTCWRRRRSGSADARRARRRQLPGRRGRRLLRPPVPVGASHAAQGGGRRGPVGVPAARVRPLEGRHRNRSQHRGPRALPARAVARIARSTCSSRATWRTSTTSARRCARSPSCAGCIRVRAWSSPAPDRAGRTSSA